MKKNIAIVAGGDSSEWVVSMKSAQGLSTFIDSEKYNIYVVTIRDGVWQVVINEQTQLPVDKNDFSFIRNGEKTTFDFAYITIHGTPGENGTSGATTAPATQTLPPASTMPKTRIRIGFRKAPLFQQGRGSASAFCV